MSPAETSREDIDFERLASYLKALAHPGRLEILWRLRFPATPAEVVVRPRRRDADLQQERAMSRQSIAEHLETLEGVGVVNKLPGDEEGSAAKWVTSAQHVFAVIEDLRRLTTIEPQMRVDVDATFAAAKEAAPDWPAGPKLVLVSGPWEGRAFALAGAGPWTIGRSRSQTVALTYDPYASAEGAAIARNGTAFTLASAPGARNPPRVNFAAVHAAKPRALAPGDVVQVGRSLLVFQER